MHVWETYGLRVATPTGLAAHLGMESACPCMHVHSVCNNVMRHHLSPALQAPSHRMEDVVAGWCRGVIEHRSMRARGLKCRHMSADADMDGGCAAMHDSFAVMHRHDGQSRQVDPQAF